VPLSGKKDPRKQYGTFQQIRLTVGATEVQWFSSGLYADCSHAWVRTSYFARSQTTSRLSEMKEKVVQCWENRKAEFVVVPPI